MMGRDKFRPDFWKALVSGVVTVAALAVVVLFAGAGSQDGEQRSETDVEPTHSAPLSAASQDPDWLAERKRLLGRTVRTFVRHYQGIDPATTDYVSRLEGHVTERFLENYTVGTVSEQAQAYIQRGWKVVARPLRKSIHAELYGEADEADVGVDVRVEVVNDRGETVSTQTLHFELATVFDGDRWLVDEVS